ncbi:MAG: MobA/MobL family protein, partial [Lachnospiraceae bacterium]|nr:MobA/MobL family protein [Lachnospiraceae bacterium]
MAIYHLHVSIISRKTGRSAVAAAAYRAAEKLHDNRYSNAVNAAAYRSGENLQNERDGITHNYTFKRGVVHTEIMLPQDTPKEYANRATLWNSV